MDVLKGINVIDFSKKQSGQFCTMQLADFGAKVTKVEVIGDETNKDYEYASNNRNKESFLVDLSQDNSKDIVLELISGADIVVDDSNTGILNKLSITLENIKDINSEVIFTNIANIDNDCDLSDFNDSDALVQAMSGLIEMTGFKNEDPVKCGVSVADKLTGLMACVGTVMAYINKLNTGLGEVVSISKFDTIFSILESPIIFKTLLGEDSNRVGNGDPLTLVPYDVFKCSDGYFSAGLAGDSGWDRFCSAIEMPELIEDERFTSNELRCKNHNLVTPIISKFFEGKTQEELQNIFSEYKIPNAPVLSVDKLINNPQLKARDMVVEIEDENVGKYIAINNPMKLEATPAVIYKGSPCKPNNYEEVNTVTI